MSASRAILFLPALGLALLGSAEPSRSPARAGAHERLRELADEIEGFREATGELPSSVEGIEGVASEPRLLVDPWGNPVVYLRVAGGFWLLSWGADGAPGGEGDAADLVHIAR